MNTFVKYLSFFAMAGLAFVATDAFAEGVANVGSADVFSVVLERMVTTFQNVRSVIFVVGGFGLVGLAFGAIFGKVSWKWLAALACGLAIVAVAGAVVDYVTQADSAKTAYAPGQFGDTLY
ncbi:MAG: TrbC/VirB2 family protein [Alphaproteobacteria bacterium]